MCMLPRPHTWSNDVTLCVQEWTTSVSEWTVLWDSNTFLYRDLNKDNKQLLVLRNTHTTERANIISISHFVHKVWCSPSLVIWLWEPNLHPVGKQYMLLTCNKPSLYSQDMNYCQPHSKDYLSSFLEDSFPRVSRFYYFFFWHFQYANLSHFWLALFVLRNLLLIWQRILAGWNAFFLLPLKLSLCLHCMWQYLSHQALILCLSRMTFLLKACLLGPRLWNGT